MNFRFIILILFSEKESNEDEDPISSSCDCNSELNLDIILHRPPRDEIELNEETCSRLNDKLSPLPSLNLEQIENHIVYNDESIISDQLDDCLTTETLAENDQLLPDKNSRISLFKLDKSTSTHSLSPIIKKQSNIFNDFFTDLFIFEKNTSRNYTLGKHENWIANATTSYLHPFHDHPHQQCFNTTDKKTNMTIHTEDLVDLR